MSTSSFFVPAPNDWAANALSTLFASHSAVSAVLGLYNTIFLAIGGTMLTWVIVRAIVETAQHGQVMGKHSEVWFPIKFVLCVGLITPLPPAGLSGGQNIVIGVARMGLAAGTAVWDEAVDQMSNLNPLVAPVPPQVHRLAKQIWDVEICRAIQNVEAGQGGGPSIKENTVDVGGEQIYREDGDPANGGTIGQCGAIAYRQGHNVSTAGDLGTDLSAEYGEEEQILKAQEAAGKALEASLQTAAETLAPTLLPPYPSAKTPVVDINQILQAYTSTLMASVGNAVAAGDSTQMDALKTAAKSGGWVNAGAWALNLLWINQRIWDAAGDLPHVTAPQYGWWGGRIYARERAAFVKADQWWDQRYAMQTASTNTDAYNATLGQSAESGILSFFDLSRDKGIYNLFLMSGQDTNPLSEMMGLGHHLLLLFWGSVGAYLGADSVAAAAQNFSSSTLEGFVGNFLVGGTASAAAAGAYGFLKAAGPIFYFLALSLLMAGIGLAYILPIVPALHWIFAVARYFWRIAMTVAGVPVWSIAHLELDGEGIGGRASKGYEALYDILIRPMVMVVGLVLGFALMIIFGQLFVLVFTASVGNALAGHYGGITGLLTYLVIGAITIVILCHIAMTGISKGPDLVMQMIGIHTGAGIGDTEADVGKIHQDTKGAGHAGQQSVVSGLKASREEQSKSEANDRSGNMSDNIASASDQPMSDEFKP